MLTGSQRKYLRGLAHSLRPLVQIGKEGVSPSVLEAIDRALQAHELIKVQVMAERDERQEAALQIERKQGCQCVGLIGKMAIFYRPHGDPEREAIQLPT